MDHGHVNQSYVKLPEGIEQENRKTRRIDYVEEHGKAWVDINGQDSWPNLESPTRKMVPNL